MRLLLVSSVVFSGCGLTVDGPLAEGDQGSLPTVGTVPSPSESDEPGSLANEAGPIRVTVYQWGSDVPLSGANVQFIAPDQTTQTVQTDLNGVAEASSPASSRVLVFQPGESNHPLVRVFEAANPGDEILVGHRRREGFAQLGTISFVLPRRGWANGDYYMLKVSCSPDGGAWPEPQREVRVFDCRHATRATAVAWIEDGSGELLTGPSVLENIDLTAHVGGTIRMPPYDAKLLTTVTSQISNLPAGSTDVAWATNYFRGDDPTVLTFTGASAPPENVINSRPMLAVGDRTLSTLRFRPPGFSNVHHHTIDAARTTSYVVDVGQTVRPVWFPSFDASTQTITWAAASYGQPASLVYGLVSATTNLGTDRVRIEIYAPGDTTTLTLPPLPAELTPQTTDQTRASSFFYRIEGENYSQSMELASSRDPLNPYLWSPLFTGEVWIAL